MFEWLFKKNQQKSDLPSEIKRDFVVLMILDGFGIHPDKLGNAVLQANTPFLDRAWSCGRSTLIHASGTHVGLPQDEAGNSEVGHLNIGTGQVVYQSLPRIDDAIRNNELRDNEVIKEAIAKAKERKTQVHLLGILSAGGVHGHIDHLFHLMDICKDNGISPCVHAILDGRDTGATDGYFYVSKLVQRFKDLGIGKLASVMGRFYGMDRDNRWERTQEAYECLVGKGKRTSQDAFALLQEAYKNNELDQYVIPTTMVDKENKPVGAIGNGDIVVFYNYREDRARQITKAFVIENFASFQRSVVPAQLYFVTMTGYEEDLPAHVVFPPKKISDTLSTVLSENRVSQLHISETEKFMHVTYFFNGGVDQPHAGEDFFNIPSPKVFDYSTVPEMSGEIIKDEAIYRLNNFTKKKYGFILINFANPDMLGHTGNLQAAIKANEYVDSYVKEISEKALEMGGAVIIIADHGNCETMIDRVTKKIDTAHTNNPVPFILLSDINDVVGISSKKIIKIGTGSSDQITGILADVAPTVLSVLDIEPPQSMTGVNLLSVI